MGQLGRQSVYGFMSSYIGMILGVLNKIFLFPVVFKDHAEYWGLLELYVAWATIIGAVGHLGMPFVIKRFLPGMEKGKSQLIGFTLIVSTIGCIILLLLMWFFKLPIISFAAKEADVGLFSGYYVWLLALVAIMLYFDYFSAILTAHFKAHLPIFINNIVFRTGVMLVIFLYFTLHLTLHTFVILYIAVYLVMLGIAVLYLHSRKMLSFKLTFKLPERSSYAQFGLFSVLSGSSAWIANYMDAIFVSKYLALSAVPILALSKNIISVMHIPARSVVSASIPMVSRAWKERDMTVMQSIYYKTAIAEFLIGGLIFLSIWINIDWFLALLPGDAWGQAKWVILVLGLGLLADLSAGANMSIIGHSPHYTYVLWVNVGAMLLAVALNVWLTPVYGIIGAAAALSSSITANNIAMVILLWWKERIQPFHRYHVSILSYFLFLGVPLSFDFNLPFTAEILIKNIVFAGVSAYLLLIVKPLPEVLTFIDFAWNKIIREMKKWRNKW
jgi:O-antigen/teichoic acid export membrane protein